jgi:hypothetical protein
LFDRCAFIGNRHSNSAGAVSIQYTAGSGGQSTFDSCEYSNNSGTCGALNLRCVPDHLLSVTASTFVANQALCAGCSGGAACLSQTEFVIRSTVFANNTADYGGGALSLSVGAFGQIAGSTFVRNAADVENEIDSQALPNSLSVIDSNFWLLPPTQLNLSLFSVALNVPGVRLSNTSLQCDPGFEVYHANRLFGCQYCQDTYNIAGGLRVDDSPVSGCLSCPFGTSLKVHAPRRFDVTRSCLPIGATCSGGPNVLAKRGYWSQDSAALYFVPCQLGYCCADSDSCPWNAVCRCVFFEALPLVIRSHA